MDFDTWVFNLHPRWGFKTFAIGRGKGKEELARKLGAIHYIDSQSQNAAEDLAKMGGAKVKNPLPSYRI